MLLLLLLFNYLWQSLKLKDFFVTSSSIATLIGVITALFKEHILSFIFEPELRIECDNKPPFFVEVSIPKKDCPEENYRQKWLRIGVTNEGNWPAKNVQVFFKGISSNANMTHDFKGYISLPLNRSWSQENKTRFFYLPPYTPILWDICYFRSDKKQRLLYFSFAGTPLDLTNILWDNKTYFEFEIKAIADNAKTSKARFRIMYSEDYENGLKIKRIL
ncbi:hypothetical protein HZB01_04250 [Candidatus Woesearchaeota archaeon]|nr:hypothetical protein [Candidatus Woesearchaeota archaeon]